jgi:Copper binding proteins, plastocyanin/azurin family
MRRPIAVLLVLCAAAAGTMALGSALAARSTAAKSPLAGLDRTFRALQPAARCAAGADKAATARRLRAAALKNAAKAPPKVLKRKKASMRRAIRLLRQAGDLCKAASPPPGTPGTPGTPTTPTTPTPPTPPSPPPPGGGTFSFTGVSFSFSPDTPITATAGLFRLQLTVNGGSHNIGARTNPGGVSQGNSSTVSAGNSTSVDITLGPGSYQIYCAVPGHAAAGMVVPLTVN